MLLLTLDVNVILGMDWLVSCFDKMDCHYKQVKFKFLRESSFVIYGHNSLMFVKVRSIMAARRILGQEGQRYLEMMRDIPMDEESLDSISVIGEHSDVFPN